MKLRHGDGKRLAMSGLLGWVVILMGFLRIEFRSNLIDLSSCRNVPGPNWVCIDLLAVLAPS